MTNGDKIRHLTDEELAKVLTQYNCALCVAYDVCNKEPRWDGTGCEDYVLDWLKQETVTDCNQLESEEE